MATTSQGRISKRASAILKQRQKEFQKQFRSCGGNTKKVKQISKEYRKKYGATPTKRWHNALRTAKHINDDTQKSIRLK